MRSARDKFSLRVTLQRKHNAEMPMVIGPVESFFSFVKETSQARMCSGPNSSGDFWKYCATIAKWVAKECNASRDFGTTRVTALRRPEEGECDGLQLDAWVIRFGCLVRVCC